MNRLFYIIDRVLSKGNSRQLLWLVSGLVLIDLLFWMINIWLGRPFRPFHMLMMMFMPGTFFMDDYLLFQVIVNVVGILGLSTLLISMLTNVLINRAEAFRKELARFDKFASEIMSGGTIASLQEHYHPY